MLRRFGVFVALALVAACAPAERENPNHDPSCPGANLSTDEENCGSCGHACGSGQVCSDGVCGTEGSNCTAGAMEACYSGPTGTENIGACKGGTRSCTASGFWGPCEGEITPQLEVCGNGVDDNCSGTVDEDQDNDHDGFTTCQGDCCDNTSQCSQPELVNPGAFEAADNLVDDDCDGQVDNAAATTCDTGLASNSADGMDYARAMDLCQTATMNDKKWGVISATWSLADGTGMPKSEARSIRSSFGTNVTPRAGASLFEIATGNASDANDSNPGPGDWNGGQLGTLSGYPADWFSLNGNHVPNAPGCPDPLLGFANDPVMLTLKIRTPTNAKSFSLQSNFFSAEYPEWVCTEYNDFFVVLLDSTWDGTPANPHDKNLATYTAPGGMKYPVGVNLATGDTGLFTQCMNGRPGCALGSGTQAPITSCTSTSDLAGTGLDVPNAAGDTCNGPSMMTGGGTGWLTTSGNVKGGEIITLRIAVWDTGDDRYSSLAVLDNFQWAVDSAAPGTIPQ